MSFNKRLPSDLTQKIFSVFLDFDADCPPVDKRMQVERPRKPRGLCDSGLQLRVSGYVRKVRQAVTLVLIVQKMKRPKGSLMEHVMADQAVVEVPLDSDSSRDWDSPWHLDIFWNSDNSQNWDNSWYLDILWYSDRSWHVDLSWYPDSSQSPDSARYPDSSQSPESARYPISSLGDLSEGLTAKPYEIYDVRNKYWVLQQWNSIPPMLTAMMLQYPDTSMQVTLLISTFIPQSNHGSGQLMTLGIKGTNYFLSCSSPPDSTDSPVLNLETVEGPISTRTGTSRFLFYRRDSGTTTAFESFFCSGWFISNHRCFEYCPVAMCKVQDSSQRVTHFNLSRNTNPVNKQSARQRQESLVSQRLPFRHLRRKTPLFRLCF
ncbi:uncharacterized protein LOC117969124 [Acipenser ruthenus]|uniref:uncharacterized protein LOC117969124 n=1 Tax=Acipenser ruthenus TaxID=7906 RepID=UPI002742891F|nr:uncharacterized protein LOC117969124 [Acipenser ruthenus]